MLPSPLPARAWLGDLVLLAALWGASFLCMRLGAVEFGPVPTAGLRVAVAAVVLLPLLLNYSPRLLGNGSPVIGAVLVLVGGLILRYAIVMAGQHVAIAGG